MPLTGGFGRLATEGDLQSSIPSPWRCVVRLLVPVVAQHGSLVMVIIARRVAVSIVAPAGGIAVSRHAPA
jgi:hypothetical protein